MLELETLMAPPKVSTRKVTLDGGITKFQNEKLTTLASSKGSVVVRIPFFSISVMYAAVATTLRQMAPHWVLFMGPHTKQKSIDSNMVVFPFHRTFSSHISSATTQKRRRRGCLSPPIILAGGVRFPVKNHSKKSIKKRKIQFDF